ncbi:MAG: TlpA disulfide reductase family protein [Gammaproteobacteria bacterium]
MLRAFSIIVVGALVASLAWAADAVKGPAPGFTLQSRDGNRVSLAEFKGQVVMINFWATWCVPCRQEMPHLEALYQRYNKLGFKLLAVNVENKSDGVKKWLAETPVSFPVLFDTKSEVTKLYKVETMPSTVIVAKDGTMRYVHHGYQAGYENDYQTEVRTLLRE